MRTRLPKATRGAEGLCSAPTLSFPSLGGGSVLWAWSVDPAPVLTVVRTPTHGELEVGTMARRGPGLAGEALGEDEVFLLSVCDQINKGSGYPPALHPR